MTSPLDKIELPGNILDRVAALEAELRALQTRDTIARDVSEVSDDLGIMYHGQFRAVDADGRVRMIMSAINLMEEFGISAHFAGFDISGTPMVWLSADNGKIYAGAGRTVLDNLGLRINNLSEVEVVRIGNLVGFLNNPADTYGWAVGDASSYAQYDHLNGLNIIGKGTIFTRNIIPATETVTVGDGYCFITGPQIDIDGDLYVIGDMMLIV